MDMMEPGRFLSSNYATPMPLTLNPPLFNNSSGILTEPAEPRSTLAPPPLSPTPKPDPSPAFGESMLHASMLSPFQGSMLNLRSRTQRDSVIFNDMPPSSLPLYPVSSSIVPPVSPSSFSSFPFDATDRSSFDSAQQSELQSRIPSYIREVVQSHKDFPPAYNRLLSAKPAPILEFPAETLSFAQLQRQGLQEPFRVNGAMEGCSYPLESLSLGHFMQQLGEFYEGSVQMVRESEGDEA